MVAKLLAAALVAALAAIPTVAPLGALPAHPAEEGLASTGRWLAPFDGEVPAVNMVLLRNGRVLYWSGVDGHDGTTLPYFVDPPAPALARVLDLSGPAPRVLVPSPEDGGDGDMFCSGQTVLANGEVLVVGGTRWETLVPLHEGWHVYGLDSARLYDPDTNAFEVVQSMVGWRWYPTAMTLQDGSALVASGIGDLPNPLTHQRTLERFDPHTHTWSTLPDSANNLLPLYPRLFVAPSGPLKGDVVYAPVGCLWCPFGEHPEEALWNLDQSLDLGTQEWTLHGPALLGARHHAAAVMLALRPPAYHAEVLTFGGTLNRATVATNTAEIADLGVAPPARALATPMVHARWHLNGVLLPTGEVLAVGGGLLDNVMAYSAENPPVLPAEIFDPEARDPTTGLRGTWTELAAMEVPRMYHSTAVLLPDGRVLAGGHVPLPFVQAVIPQINEKRLEVFEPPYLFRGPRPVIAGAPDHVHHGEAFLVGSPDAARVTQAVLMRPGATTHAWDNEQRLVELEILGRSEGRLTLRAPPDADVAAPGHWMLFLLQDHGQGPVPSVARFVALEAP